MATYSFAQPVTSANGQTYIRLTEPATVDFDGLQPYAVYSNAAGRTMAVALHNAAAKLSDAEKRILAALTQHMAEWNLDPILYEPLIKEGGHMRLWMSDKHPTVWWSEDRKRRKEPKTWDHCKLSARIVIESIVLLEGGKWKLNCSLAQAMVQEIQFECPF